MRLPPLISLISQVRAKVEQVLSQKYCLVNDSFCKKEQVTKVEKGNKNKERIAQDLMKDKLQAE